MHVYSYSEYPVGAYDLRVRSSGSTTALLSRPGQQLEAYHRYDIVLYRDENNAPQMRVIDRGEFVGGISTLFVA